MKNKAIADKILYHIGRQSNTCTITIMRIIGIISMRLKRLFESEMYTFNCNMKK